MPLVLGVDSSTQSTKVELRDADDGRLVASARAAHPATTPPRSEQDAGAWWNALREAVGALPRQEIAGISIAAQQMGLVATDASMAPLRPAKLWNDTESAGQSRRLIETWGAARWARACGSVPVPSFTVTKLAWLRDQEASTYRRLAHVCVPHDWLTYRLTGSFVTDRGDASATGWWSPFEERYSNEVLALLDGGRDWEGVLPEVLSPLAAAGTLGSRCAADLGLIAGARGALVAAGTGDNMAAALGVGLAARDAVVSLGTSGTVYALSEEPTADASGTVGGFADATGGFLPLACTLNATKVTDTFSRLLAARPTELDALALAAAPGARGLTLVPYLDGERTPNRPEATGALVGLRSSVDRADLARAAFEGVVCGLLEALDALAAAGVDTGGRLLLVGGGAKSPAYRRILADLSQRVVSVPCGSELVATGACVQAAAVLHGCSTADVSRAWSLGKCENLEPDQSVDAQSVRAAFRSAQAERAN